MMLLPALTALPFLLQAQTPPPADAKQLRTTVEKLVSFGTRHTLSSATDPRRGIGAARDWTARRFTEIARACGGCITVERPAARFDGPRAPAGVIVENVLGIQWGTDRNLVVIVAGHIDSRVSEAMDFTSDAPGANDDASGVAVVMEAARLLSRGKHHATIVYAVLSGEEQGLWGGRLLATTAKARSWTVAGMLNNDIVGNTIGQNGAVVADRVRIFSEGIRSSEELPATRARRGNGGEDDSSSRALAKAIGQVAKANPRIGLEAFLVRRPDRFGRGGDHTALLDAGYPAVRFSVGIENYDQQHQDLRTENGRVYGDTVERMDFPYLAKVASLNIAMLARLAAAPAAPEAVTIAGAVSSDTTVRWAPSAGAASYIVHWRRNDRQDWAYSQAVTGTTELVLKDVNIDDHFFGVSAVAGGESIVTFAGPAVRN